LNKRQQRTLLGIILWSFVICDHQEKLKIETLGESSVIENTGSRALK